MRPLMHHVLCRVFWRNLESPRWLSPSTAQILAFLKTKITFEKEISDHRWASGKHDRAVDGNWENCVWSQGAYFEGDWGVIVLCAMFLVSCIFFNKCLYFSYYMAGYLLEIPHIVHQKITSPPFILPVPNAFSWASLLPLQLKPSSSSTCPSLCFFLHTVARVNFKKYKREPWPVWLIWLGVIPQGLRLPLRFPVRAHVCVSGSVLGCRHVWGATNWCFSPSLSFSLPMKINKIFKKYKGDPDVLFFSAVPWLCITHTKIFKIPCLAF